MNLLKDSAVRTYGLVWVLLLLLTATTVVVASIDMGFLNVAAALAIATVKASLVALYFMHLRHESRVIAWGVLLTLSLLALFIGFIYFDISGRYA